MLKINISDFSFIEDVYSLHILPDVESRLEFTLNFLEFLKDSKNKNFLASRLNFSTRKSIIDTYLEKPTAKGADFSRIRIIDCKAKFRSKINECIHLVENIKLKRNYEKALYVKPSGALDFEKAILDKVNLDQGIIKSILEKIFLYKNKGKLLYKLTHGIGLRTCPYCNRIHIDTILDKKGDGVIRGHLDHFFSQSEHPLLALNFYNLIPSCYYCNSQLKLAIEMNQEYFLHPYLEGFGKDAFFTFRLIDLKKNKSDYKNYKVEIRTTLKENEEKYSKIFGKKNWTKKEESGNSNLFRLEDIYQTHTDIIGDIIVKCDKLSEGYSKSLATFFKEIETDREEFYKFYFGNHYLEEDFHKRPLAKFTRDIVDHVFSLHLLNPL